MQPIPVNRTELILTRLVKSMCTDMACCSPDVTRRRDDARFLPHSPLSHAIVSCIRIRRSGLIAVRFHQNAMTQGCAPHSLSARVREPCEVLTLFSGRTVVHKFSVPCTVVVLPVPRIPHLHYCTREYVALLLMMILLLLELIMKTHFWNHSSDV